jgi:hypothetical protein
MTDSKPKVPRNIKLGKDEILVLRSNKSDMTSYNGFKWPLRGPVEAPDWKNTDKCGNGLHGLPWGVGGNYCNMDDTAVWIVVRVSTRKGRYQHGSGEMTDKCKFKSGVVIFSGTRDDAVAVIAAQCPMPWAMRWWPASTSGENAPASTSGANAPASTSGRKAPASTSGWNAPASTSGEDAPASTSGENAPASTSGADSCAIALGIRGLAAAGKNGIVAVKWYDGRRYRLVVGYVGENGIKPNAFYCCNNMGKLEEVK